MDENRVCITEQRKEKKPTVFLLYTHRAIIKHEGSQLSVYCRPLLNVHSVQLKLAEFEFLKLVKKKKKKKKGQFT